MGTDEMGNDPSENKRTGKLMKERIGQVLSSAVIEWSAG
jgi:hypothetical protein